MSDSTMGGGGVLPSPPLELPSSMPGFRQTGAFVPGVGDSRRDVVSRARCLSRVRWADAPERGGVVQARPSAVRGFPERRDGLPSQGALHALRRERPGARTVPCARAHGHAGARPSGRGPAGLRADAHGRRPGHRIVPPGRQVFVFNVM